MSESIPAEPGEQRFLSSSKSQAAKVRIWLYGGLMVGLAIGWATSRSLGPLLFTALVLLGFVGVIDWFIFRPQAKSGQTVFRLTDVGIESPRFNTKQKFYRWSEVAGVSLEVMQGAKLVQLELKPSEARPDKRAFLNGINLARPMAPLAALTEEDQEKALQAITERINASANPSGFGTPRAAPVNQLTEERLFAERMKALAPVTWVVWILIGLNISIWVLTVALGGGLLQGQPEKLLAWGGNSASEVQQGEWWRLLTATFLHSGVLHVGMNMLGLWATGVAVERIYGHRLFLLIYLGAGLVGSAASLHFSAQKVVSVGASGAVFGVAGALLVAVFHHRKQLPKLFGKQTLSGIGFFVVYSLAQGFARPGIDNAAHLGGLAAGAVLAWILPERFDLAHFHRSVRSRTAVAFALAVSAVVGVVVSAPSAPFDLSERFEASAAFAKGMKSFDSAMKAMGEEVALVKAGKMTEMESDSRSRTVHAPRFREVQRELSAARFDEADPRAPLAKEMRRMVDLFLESLAMASNVVDGKPEPADPARAAAIQSELMAINGRLPKLVEQVKANPNR
jgi:rhomboid protease GluP